MRVVVNSEERFSRTPDGKVWSAGAGAYSFWRRYLDVFDQVRVLGRVAPALEQPESAQRADGDGVTFESLPYYVGPIGYARKYFSVRAAIRKTLVTKDAVVLRAASPIANCVESDIASGQPYGIEVVGDPYEVFAPGSIEHPLRPLLRWVMTDRLKRQCRRACAAAYVTGGALMDRYPSRSSAFTTIYSSIELRDDAYAAQSRSFEIQSRPLRIVSVGTLEVPYKGFDVLIDAVAACVQRGADIELTIAGDGRRRDSLKRQAERRGIERVVHFLGHCPAGAGVRDELDRADLFVLASKTEGLPRAMLEAMARALPCIGTAVGGIPELLAPGELVPRDDAPALARKITEILADRGRMTRLSAENLAKARQYHSSNLSPRRREFLTHVQEATQRWRQRHPHARLERDLWNEKETMQPESSR
jgi:glycosyltransferase involved in cell wall biosynthesis